MTAKKAQPAPPQQPEVEGLSVTLDQLVFKVGSLTIHNDALQQRMAELEAENIALKLRIESLVPKPAQDGA